MNNVLSERRQPAPLDAATFMQQHGGSILRAISPDPDADRMHVEVLKLSASTLTMSAKVGDEKRLIKHFRPDCADAQSAFRRERDAHRVFNRSGLCPALLKISEGGRFLISSFVEGSTVRSAITRGKLPDLCSALGRWLGKMTVASPFEKIEDNWFDYLSRYDALRSDQAINASKTLLKSLKISRKVLAKNDGALTNFLLQDDGTVFGIDFEQSRFKPAGWDLLLTARALARLFPDQADELAHLLAEGYCECAPGNAQQYAALVKIFVIATAFETIPSKARTPAARAQACFNRTAEIPATVLGTPPFQDSILVAPDANERARFLDHIDRVVANLWADQSVLQGEPDDAAKRAERTPSIGFRAICTACQGSCCTLGRGKNAFIDRQTIANLRWRQPNLSSSDAAAMYVDRLPPRIVENSCLYHGATGCALPRELRSATCNTYTCNAAKTFLTKLKTAEPEGALCIAGQGASFRKAVQIRGSDIADVPIEELEER